jgi:hypothetical protein
LTSHKEGSGAINDGEYPRIIVQGLRFKVQGLRLKVKGLRPTGRVFFLSIVDFAQSQFFRAYAIPLFPVPPSAIFMHSRFFRFAFSFAPVGFRFPVFPLASFRLFPSCPRSSFPVFPLGRFSPLHFHLPRFSPFHSRLLI